VRQRFTGYQKDEETQLDFAKARMYENRHARFTAIDPLLSSGKSANPQTFNRYVYVMNNPLAYTDPSGLQAGTWAYRDGVENGVQMRSFRFFRSQVDRETAEAVYGTYTNWTGNNFYVFGNAPQAVSLPENGNGMMFSTEGIPADTMTGIVSTQQSGGQFSEEQNSALTQAQTDTYMQSFDFALKKGTSGLAGGAIAGGLTQGTNFLLRSVAFGTERNSAVFFSGTGAATQANQFAASTGGQTIGMTPGGSVINSITSATISGQPVYKMFPYATQRLWGWGSRHFAEGASGQVHFFGRTPHGPIWSSIERPILLQNQTRIVNVRIAPTFVSQ
jgi:RHS repeat-associated protein